MILEKPVSFSFSLPQFVRTACVLVCCLLGLLACGGGVGEGGTGGVRTQSTGRVTATSETTLEVNGVTYDTRQAKIVDGFEQPAPIERVTLGAWVDVEGQSEGGGRSAVAQLIRVRPAMRGKLTQLDVLSKRLSVLGSQGQLNRDVVFQGVDDQSQLREGDWVEVHGALGQEAGQIDVTRVERLDTASALYELRGVVSRVNATDRTMTVGGQKIDYAQASVAVRVALQAGAVVRVSSSRPPADDQRWSVERVVDDQWLVGSAAQVYLEGVVTQWQAGPVFVLEGVVVDASGADKASTVTGNGLRVAVVGTLQAGVLRAQAVRVTTPGEPVVFTLSGVVKQFKSLADFHIGNVAIDASSAKLVGGTTADLANGRKVKVRGEVRPPGLYASRLEFED
jgi:Domain of unknown function (DUF5666)